MLRSLPPAGSPILANELSRAFQSIFSSRFTRAELEIQFSQFFDGRNAFLFSTGRGAMTFALRCLNSYQPDRKRNTVIVPSYTCYSVAASILAAGLNVLVCDIDKKTLSFDEEQLESIDYTSVLAIVSANLYGLPNNLEHLEKIASREGIYLLDDAAQSLGATISRRKAGTFGHLGLFSLDKGKTITSMNGGILITDNKDLASILKREYLKLPELSRTECTKNYAKLLVYFLFLRPNLYWIPQSIPLLGLGSTVYDEEIDVALYQSGIATIARNQLNRLDLINKSRQIIARNYQSSIVNTSLIKTFDLLPTSKPVYLRYPIRILDSKLRESFLHKSRDLGTSRSYPKSIASLPQLRDRISIHNNYCESGIAVADQIVTLPTHSYVLQSDVERLAVLIAAVN